MVSPSGQHLTSFYWVLGLEPMTQLPLGRKETTKVQLNLGSASACVRQEAWFMTTVKCLSLCGQVSEFCSHTSDRGSFLASADPLVRRYRTQVCCEEMCKWGGRVYSRNTYIELFGHPDGQP